MIARICGILIEKNPPALLIDVNGVGYHIDAPMTTIYNLPELGTKIILHTHLVVKEDAQQLYGFINKRDRQLFRDLIKISGIGAKMALAILSGMDTDTIISCISMGDDSMLVKIPGIGRKTAQRLIIETKDRITNWPSSEQISLKSTNIITTNKNLDDAMSALIALGYKAPDIKKMLAKLNTENLSSEEIIRLALKKIVA